jgi:hypothetical protein
VRIKACASSQRNLISGSLKSVLTMPKVLTKSTDRRKARLLQIREIYHVIAYLCQRCDSKGLKCLLSLEGNCLECVAATVSCSLFPSEEDFAAVR